MRGPLIAILLLTVPLTGCLDGTSCGPYYSATWTDPGLFEAIADAPGRDEVYTLEPGIGDGRYSFLPEGTLAFDGTVANVSSEHLALMEVRYTSHGEGRHSDQAILQALPGEDPDHAQIRLEVWGNKTRAELGALLDPLVGNLTTADAATREGWLDALAADRRQGSVAIHPGQEGPGAREVQWIHTVNATHAWTPERVLAEHLSDSNTSTPEGDPGQALLSGESWTLSLWPDGWTATFDAEDPPIELTVDAFDRVELDRKDGLWENASRTQAWVNASFEDAGLPAPTFTAWHYSAVVC